MRTIVCEFESNGQTVKRTAIISDDLSTLSNSKKNQAGDICEMFPYEHTWCLYFPVNEQLGYEIQFKTDEYGNKTLDPVKAITWEGKTEADVITDVQPVEVFVK